MAHAILLHEPNDDVGVAVRDLKKGESVGAVTLEGKFVTDVKLVDTHRQFDCDRRARVQPSTSFAHRKKLERYAMLVLGARKWGLTCSITRFIYFGKLPDEIRRKADAVARVDATFIAHTRPGKTLGEIFSAVTATYAEAIHQVINQPIHCPFHINSLRNLYFEHDYPIGV